MLICERFVYIHMPKTGGTFVRRALRRLLKDCNIPFIEDPESKHSGVEQIPASCRHLPILATIRNPFDHHVSFYEFGWWKKYANDTFNDEKMREKFSGYPEITFPEYLRSVYDWSLLSSSYLSSEVRESCQSAGVGHLTADHIRYFSETTAVCLSTIGTLTANELQRTFATIEFLHTERLNEHLHLCLSALGFKREDLAFIATLGRALPPGGVVRQCRDWTSYYTSDMERLVRYRERMLFEVFPHFDPNAGVGTRCGQSSFGM